MAEIVLTPEGKARTEQELEELKGKGREEVAEHLRHAIETGGELTENAEYLGARDEQSLLERRITELEHRLADAQVVKRRADHDLIDVGAHVRLRDRNARRTEEYDIVGSGEGNPSAGRISRESPLGSALLGHREGDLLEIATPAGIRPIKILAVT